MPAKDRYHDAVVRAVVKDGWTIAAQQVGVLIAGRRLRIDIRAVNASQSVAILVDVKGFENTPSPVDYLAETVGKYVLYRSTLDYVGITEPLYLAVPHAAYMGILSEAIGQQVISKVGISLMVFDPRKEDIVQWIPL